SNTKCALLRNDLSTGLTRARERRSLMTCLPPAGDSLMQVAQDTVVFIHYTLTDDAGKTIDSSAGGEPLAYLHGNGNLIPGLERALEGKKVGDLVSVRLSPAEGYGEYD